MTDSRTVFVLLLGRKEEHDHYQLLQEAAALEAAQRHGLHVEVSYAPAFDQLRGLRKRLLETERVDAVIVEPASVSLMDLILRDLRDRTSLVLLNAWGSSVEEAAGAWGHGHACCTVGTNQAGIGRIQAAQVRGLAAQGGMVLCVTGPRRSSAAQERLESLRAGLGSDVELVDTEAGAWTEAAGIVAFGDWCRVFKARNPALVAVAAQSDELAMGVRSAIRGLPDAAQREALAKAKLLGVDGCPAYGKRLVDYGTLAATVVTPANTGLALDLLQRFWTIGEPLPLRSFTEPQPYPATSV
jgi:ABC-type sugar transport system substrate-binding protein